MGIGFGGNHRSGQRIDLIDLGREGLSVNDVTEMPVPHGIRPDSGRLVLGPDGHLYGRRSTRVHLTASRRNKATLRIASSAAAPISRHGYHRKQTRRRRKLEGTAVALALVFATPIFAQEAMTIEVAESG